MLFRSERRAWSGYDAEHEHGDGRPYARFLLEASAPVVTAEVTKQVLVGDFVSQIEQYLLTDKHGIKDETLSNNINVGYRSYTVDRSTVEMLVIEDLFGDYTTVIFSTNAALIGDIMHSLEA